jgi:hypothetical protein
MTKYEVIMNNKIWNFTIEADTIQEEEIDDVKITKFYQEIDEGIYDEIDYRASKHIDYIKKIE